MAVIVTKKPCLKIKGLLYVLGRASVRGGGSPKEARYGEVRVATARGRAAAFNGSEVKVGLASDRQDGRRAVFRSERH